MNENRNDIERRLRNAVDHAAPNDLDRSEEHTSELQSQR